MRLQLQPAELTPAPLAKLSDPPATRHWEIGPDGDEFTDGGRSLPTWPIEKSFSRWSCPSTVLSPALTGPMMDVRVVRRGLRRVESPRAPGGRRPRDGAP